MARRPSAASVSSSSRSVHSNGDTINRKSTDLVSLKLSSRAPALSGRTSSKGPVYDANLDPDQLFVKHSVSEIKHVQLSLRGDADAKQEELRLMVGERYRDLLQASTSIISIAESSRRVSANIDNAKGVVQSQREAPVQKRTVAGGINDSELQMLQQLSAHIKLLLDTPEHLWRLMEKKKYYSAAWLFLLARVVHRALLEEDEEEEESWSSYDIQVSEQFPLVQRQWELVSQFRTQITQKATLALREYALTPPETCSAIITLHLLESKPLTETLSTLLSQRNRTLKTMFAWPSAQPSTSTKYRQNGHVPEMNAPPTTREVRQATHIALEAICKTVTTARAIFHSGSSSRSLISQVMQHIQTDHQQPDTFFQLPQELQLTSQSLLQALPSSSHFSFLPSNLRGYKPYVDLSSSSSSIPEELFMQKLDQWLQNAISELKKSSTRWIADVKSVKDVWNVRTWVKRWMTTNSKLNRRNCDCLISVLDEVYRGRVVELWEASFLDAERGFQSQLDKALRDLRETTVPITDKSAALFLFQAPPLPNQQASGLTVMSNEGSMDKYQSDLRRRLIGRTQLLDGVLAVLENCATILQKDLAHISTGANDDATLASELQSGYQAQSESFCSSVVSTLETHLNEMTDASDTESIEGLILLAQVTDSLATSSFSKSTIWDQPVMNGFRQQMQLLHDRTIDRWRTDVISQILDCHKATARSCSGSNILRPTPSSPSPALQQSMFSLCTGIQRLGVVLDMEKREKIVSGTLRSFITKFLEECTHDPDAQLFWDVSFLSQFATLRETVGPEWSDIKGLLHEWASKSTLSDDAKSDIGTRVSHHFTRTQVLFSILRPPASKPPSAPTATAKLSTDKMTALLTLGTPAKSSGQEEYRPAVELAKSSTRFGLLLVPSVSSIGAS